MPSLAQPRLHSDRWSGPSGVEPWHSQRDRDAHRVGEPAKATQFPRSKGSNLRQTARGWTSFRRSRPAGPHVDRSPLRSLRPSTTARSARGIATGRPTMRSVSIDALCDRPRPPARDPRPAAAKLHPQRPTRTADRRCRRNFPSLSRAQRCYPEKRKYLGWPETRRRQSTDLYQH